MLDASNAFENKLKRIVYAVCDLYLIRCKERQSNGFVRNVAQKHCFVRVFMTVE